MDSDTLAAQLQSAVSLGIFTDKLQEYAQASGATGLIGASSDEVEVNSLQGKDDDGGDGGDNEIGGALPVGTTVAIIAVVALGLAVLLMVILMVRWCWPTKKVATTSGTSTTTSTPAPTAPKLAEADGKGVELAMLEASCPRAERYEDLVDQLPRANATLQVILVAENVHINV